MNNEIMRKILSHIDEHIYEKINLTDLALLVGYSPFYFSKMFSKAMGMPVTAYIRIRKMQYAIVSLLEGKKVLEVSLLYAFDSHEGFTRAFAQLFGSTPSTVRKYLKSYKVPEYVLIDVDDRREYIDMLKQNNLQDNMHQLIYEILEQSIEEAHEGYCTKLEVQLMPDNYIKITDNGRGIPLSLNTQANNTVLDKILSGHPITNLEYSQMGDFSQIGLQIVNSLCENLKVNVYREGTLFQQDYVRGVAQHELIYEDCKHEAGMEITLKPDKDIFGDTLFSAAMIINWIKEHTDDLDNLTFLVDVIV